MIRACGLLLGCVLACSAAAGAAHAQVPLRIPVHASLTDETGRVVNGEVEIRFAIYAAAKGGEARYRETRTIAVKDGRFELLLGENQPLDPELFAAQTNLFLGVQVEQDAEAKPRLQLGSVPFAFSAEHAHDATTVAGVGVDELQRRVVGSCEDGDVMVAIEASGRVLCESLPAAMRGAKGADGAPGPAGPQGDKGERGDPGPALSFDCAGQAVSGVDEIGRPTCVPLANVNVRAGAGLAVDNCAGSTCEFSIAPDSLGMGEVNLPMSGTLRGHAQLLSEAAFFDDGLEFIPDKDGQCLVVASMEVIATMQARNPSSGRLAMRVGYREAGVVLSNTLAAFANPPTDGGAVASAVQHAVITVKKGTPYRFGCLIGAQGDWVGVPLFCQVSRMCQ